MTDQSRPVSRVSVVEALTRIRALCDAAAAAANPIWPSRIRMILDAVPVGATMSLNPLGDLLLTQGFDMDDVEVILQDVEAFFGLDEVAMVPPTRVIPEDCEAAWQGYRRTHAGLFPDARLDFIAGWYALAARLEAQS